MNNLLPADAPTAPHVPALHRRELPSDEALRLLAGYFAALADPTRLKLLRALMAGEQNVNFLVEVTGGGQSNVSRHLGRLAAAGLLHRRREGAHIFYSIADSSIHALCAHVCGTLGARLTKQASIITGAGR